MLSPSGRRRYRRATARRGERNESVIEAPVGDTDSDFFLVFGDDLEWNMAAGPVRTERLVVLLPDRPRLLEIAEPHHVAALMYYVGFDAWSMDKGVLIVRRDVAANLGGTLGPGAPYVMESQHYAGWRDAARSSLAARLIEYLAAISP